MIREVDKALHPPHLQVEPLLRTLARHRVEYALTGSVGAMAYGVQLVPRDLDIAPALTAENLEALADLLRGLRAKPKYDPSWRRGLSLEDCAGWEAKPANEENLDHRFVTSYGDFDVVPRLAGTFEHLVTRAVPMTAFTVPILVAHLDDLINLCEKWDRETDRRRLPLLLAAREGFKGTPVPADIGERLTWHPF